MRPSGERNESGRSPELIPIAISAIGVPALAITIVALAIPEPKLGSSAPAASPARSDTSHQDEPAPRQAPVRPWADRTREPPAPTPEQHAEPLHDKSQALLALAPAQDAAKKCSTGRVESMRVVVIFGPDGTVTEAKSVDEFEDEEVRECVLAELRKVRLKPFRGDPMPVVRTIVFDDEGE